MALEPLERLLTDYFDLSEMIDFKAAEGFLKRFEEGIKKLDHGSEVSIGLIIRNESGGSIYSVRLTDQSGNTHSDDILIGPDYNMVSPRCCPVKQVMPDYNGHEPTIESHYIALSLYALSEVCKQNHLDVKPEVSVTMEDISLNDMQVKKLEAQLNLGALKDKPFYSHSQKFVGCMDTVDHYSSEQAKNVIAVLFSR